jgi:hypothetical protein
MRQPRIERGAHRWQRWILPLNHWRVKWIVIFVASMVYESGAEFRLVGDITWHLHAGSWVRKTPVMKHTAA